MINAAIVGLGWWGKTLVESGENSKALRFVAAATRTQSPEVQVFVEQKALRLAANYQALLADPQIDAVVLATPHSMHAAQVIAAAGAKKHVFCEKPFTLTKREAEDAVAAVRKAGVTLDHVFTQSFRRAATIEADDTTSILFRMRDGMSGYLGTMTTTGPGFSFQVFGSKGW